MASTQQTTEHAQEDAGLIGTLGLKADVFAAQLLNFVIILFVLWKWAYKPVLRILAEREQRIARGLSDAEAAGKRLQEIDAEHAATIASARDEAARIIKEATMRGEEKREEMLVKSREEISKLVTDARVKIAEERKTAAEELKKEISALVVATAQVVLKEKIDASTDEALMEKSVKKTVKKTK